jgi:hypothetical protein
VGVFALSIIGVDVDGVLANFFKAYESLIIRSSGVNLFGDKLYPNALPQTWNWPETFGYEMRTIADVWDKIKASNSFWWHLEPLPGAEEFLRKLYESKHEAYFITDRPGVTAQVQTAQWLEKYGYKYPSVIISRKGKGAACDALSVDYYIDDKYENVVDVLDISPYTKVSLLTYPYNSISKISMPRVDNLNQFWEVIN